MRRSAFWVSLARGICHKHTTVYDIRQSRTRFPQKPQPPLKFEVIFCVRGVISPLLANLYLHYVFDLWVEAWRKKVARGDVIVVRYADDLVVGFENRADAERFLAEFRERLAKFGLELHPDKTRLIEFGRFAVRNRKQRGEGKPETFTFLGFTHFCGQLTSSGAFNVWRITAKKRMVAKLKAIKAELQRRKHHRTSRGRRVASEGCAGLLPIPCRSR